MGKPFEMNDLGDIMRAARLVEVRENIYKMPMGRWSADPVLKELGIFNQAVMLESVEPYTIGLLTNVRYVIIPVFLSCLVCMMLISMAGIGQ